VLLRKEVSQSRCVPLRSEILNTLVRWSKKTVRCRCALVALQASERVCARSVRSGGAGATRSPFGDADVGQHAPSRAQRAERSEARKVFMPGQQTHRPLYYLEPPAAPRPAPQARRTPPKRRPTIQSSWVPTTVAHRVGPRRRKRF